METLERAYGKINLSLYITGKREDGYHNLYSLMQTIELHDDIKISVIEKGIEIVSNIKDLPKDRGNTVFSAIELMKSGYNLKNGYRADIFKRIPIGAGLGGPSADAAAVIRGINNLEGLNLDLETMQRLGAEIGADVPFLIRGGMGICKGIGDMIEPIGSVLPFKILLIKPDISISSKMAFDDFDEMNTKPVEVKEKLVDFIKNGDYGKTVSELYNDLESPAFLRYPVIRDIKTFMEDMGAEASLMTGSGSCVFGLFRSENTLLECKNRAIKKYRDFFIEDTTPWNKNLL